jgi:TonB family protein
MKGLCSVALVIWTPLVGCGLPPPARQQRGALRAPEMSLCEALERVGSGEKLAATLKGIYALQFELQQLYDPSQPLCRLDVEPNTWVEFDQGVHVEKRLLKVLDRDYHAYVTLRGVLWGPPAVGPDDLSIPAWVAYARRSPGRYGHMHGWRTQFVVSEVLDWKPVTGSVPPAKPRPASSIPEVVAAAVPSYPTRALHGDITGTVVVDVTVKQGKVTATKVISGDRMLAPAVVENIQTWRFKDDVEATISTTYTFMLELRETGSDQNPRIELHLPVSAKITAPLNGW